MRHEDYLPTTQDLNMRFKTSDNLIDLLVGQNLYSNPDVALRELLQNAEDACQLMSISDSSYRSEIIIRYSTTENWFEVSDNGLGMDEEIFEESFATIGASKTESSKLQHLLEKAGNSIRPIGQFGIGVLSCFGVADTIEIYTLAEDAPPVSIRITNRRQDFEELTNHRKQRGTTIRLLLKKNGPISTADLPSAVSRYVRHANNIWIENVDDGMRQLVPEQWLLSSWSDLSAVDIDSVSSGHLQLSTAWENINHGLDGQILLCNGGFMVTDNAQDVLPDYAIGFRGEFDINPGDLTILMNREGFQQDEHWQHFSSGIKSHYCKLIEEKLDEWINDNTITDASEEKKRAIQRAILLILQTPLKEIVGPNNLDKARRLIPQSVCLVEYGSLTVEEALKIARNQPPLYVYRTDDDKTINRSLKDRGQNIQLTTPIDSLELRKTLLRLNGYAVLPTEKHTYTVYFRGRNRNVDVHDFRSLSELAAVEGIPVSLVQDAPTEHTKIGSSFESEQITNIFELPSDLKFQSVGNNDRAVVADFNGYILNSNNDEIRAILEVIPDSVGNPIRKALISAYFSLAVYDISKSREILIKIITDPNFESKARLFTGEFFHLYLTNRVQSLLSQKDSEHE